MDKKIISISKLEDLKNLKDWQLKHLIKEASTVRHKKYRTLESTRPKYGSVSSFFRQSTNLKCCF
jgi:hypothetical protein